MKPLRLCWTDFGSYRKAEIDFTKAGFFGVFGRTDGDDAKSNGAGKTTIFRAVLYALFGRFGLKSGDVSNDGFIRRGAKSMGVVFTFQKAGQTYEIQRGWDGKSTTLLVKQNDALVCKGTRVGDPYLEKLVGLDYDTFLATAFFAQGQADTFCSATPAVRKKYLRTILDLDVFERARLDAVARRGATNAEVEKDRAVMTHEESLVKPDSDFVPVLNDWGKLEAGHRARLESLRIAQAQWEQAQEVLRERDQLVGKMELEDARFSSLLEQRDAQERRVGKLGESMLLHQKELAICSRRKVVNGEEVELKAELERLREREKLVVTMGLWPEKTEELAAREKVVSDIDVQREVLERGASGLEESWAKDRTCYVCSHPLEESAYRARLENLRMLRATLAHDLVLAASAVRETEDWLARAGVEETKAIENCRKMVEADLEKVRKAKHDNDLAAQKAGTLKHLIAESEAEAKGCRECMEELSAKLRVSEVKIQELREALGKIAVPDGIDLKPRSKEIEETTKNIEEVVTARKQLEEGHRQNQEREKRVAELRKALAPKLEEMALCDELVRAFGKDGVVALLIESSLGEITTRSNEVLREMGSPMQVNFRTVKELKGGEDRESLDIVVQTPTGDCVYEICSGGEQTILNFSIRMALSWYLAGRTGAEVDMVFLDEVTGELDASNRDAILRMLGILRARFECVLAISHDALQAFFPDRITVVKENGISRIEEEAA